MIGFVAYLLSAFRGTADAPKALMHEDAFVEALRGGDRAAFRQLVERHHAALVRVAQLYAPPAAAEEAVQDTWLAVWQGIGQFEGRSSLKNWLFAIAINRAKTRGAREHREVPLADAVQHELDAPLPDEPHFRANGHWQQPVRAWPVQGIETILMHRQACAALHQAIADLPTVQRAVVTMCDIEDLDAGQVCALLQISAANQRVLLHRGRSRLRQALAESWESSC